MSTTKATSAVPTWVRALQLALLVVVVAFAAAAVFGLDDAAGPSGFDPLLDGWLETGGYVLAGLVAASRPLVRPDERVRWWLLAAPLLLRALGVLVAVTWLRTQDPPPYPSVVDVLWGGVEVLLLVLLAQRVRAYQSRFLVTLVLDSVMAALTVAAIFVAFDGDEIGRLAAPGVPTSAVATRLAYSLADLALVAMALGLLVVARGRAQVSDLVLCAGIAVFSVVDVLYLLSVARGEYRPAAWLTVMSLVATAGTAASAWAPQRPVVRQPSRRPPGLLLPACLALPCIGTLLYGDVVDVPVTGVALATAALLVAIARALLTLSVDRDYSGRELGAAADETRRLQSLVEAASDFIVMCDPEGRLTYVNPAGRRLIGLSARADVTRMTARDLLMPEDVDEVMHRMEVLLEQGTWSAPSRLRHVVTGEPIPVMTSSFLLRDADGETYAVASVQRDITEQQAAEESLRVLVGQRQRLLSRLVEAQDEERARIAADVHDDSVQALAAVELRLGMVRMDLENEAPHLLESTDKALEAVRGATSRLRHLLFDLESPARRGRLSDAIADAAYYLFEDTDLTWEVTGDVDADIPEADRVTAYRVVKEALANIRKHARASTVVVELVRRSDGLVVSVRDDGRGIDPGEDVERAGHLGLSSMRDRAEVAGGTLIVRPRPSGGTEVRLWLPSGV